MIMNRIFMDKIVIGEYTKLLSVIFPNYEETDNLELLRENLELLREWGVRAQSILSDRGYAQDKDTGIYQSKIYRHLDIRAFVDRERLHGVLIARIRNKRKFIKSPEIFVYGSTEFGESLTFHSYGQGLSKINAELLEEFYRLSNRIYEERFRVLSSTTS